MQLINDDCLNAMAKLPDKSIDLILTDPPYGTTQCKWDAIIPLEPMWEQLKRVIKPNGAIVLFGSEPFSSALRMSNIKNYKYDWVWQKSRPSGSMLAKKQPLRNTEVVSVFYKKQPCYNPQMIETKRIVEKTRTVNKGEIVGEQKLTRKFDNKGLAYPRTILSFGNSNHKSLHPTQKPLALLEYLIKTYTNANDKVLDFTMGSGSTGVACKNTNRDFIGIELDKDYFDIAKERIESILI
jgi:site-specific DNA-methyltransferase (adenine-specific)